MVNWEMTNMSVSETESDSTWVQRLQTAVRLAGGQGRVAQLTDRTTRQIRRYLDGDEAPLTVVSRIAEAANVTLDWLVSGRLPVHHLDTLDQFREAATDGAMVGESDGFVLIPRFGVAASAGAGSMVEADAIDGFISFRESWVRRTLGLNPKRLALISAEGDSMRPTITEGDVLLIDTSIRRVRDSAIYVLRLDGVLLVKRLRLRMDGSVDVISDNPAYQPELLTATHVESLSIAGRVVWHGGLV
jgi:phage repressor protein C with HTH and peptisase S24 domain